MTVRVIKDNRAFFRDVRDQGRRPTCLAHALSATHECVGKFSSHLSPEYLHHFASGGLHLQGASIQASCQSLEKHGQPVEAECPYQSVNPIQGWAPPKPSKVFTRPSKVLGKGSDFAFSAMKQHLAVVLCLDLPLSFFSPASPWVIADHGDIQGRHAVVGLGTGTFSKSDVILIRNSWGANWGDKGHAWLPREFLDHHLQEIITL